MTKETRSPITDRPLRNPGQSVRELRNELLDDRILVDGFVPDRDPIIQAKAQASWMKQLLNESTGKTFPVRPVVVFPG